MSEELINLVTETRKQLEHLRALGVENIKASDTESGIPRLQTKAARASHPEPLPVKKLPPPEPIRRRVEVETHSPNSSKKSPVSLFGDLGPQPEQLTPSSETFDEIHAEIGQCTRCPLHLERTHVVHTEGNRKARLMFVGEAPGADEDKQARPFVGRAGQLLTKIIEAIGLKREAVLIGNVNRCRPPGNRAPTTEEASMCKPFLLREIAAVQPEVIVVLGNTAMKNLLDTREGITKLRGRFQDYKGIKVMPTFHPAYLLRDPSKKRETWEDLKKVRDFLDSQRSSRTTTNEK